MKTVLYKGKENQSFNINLIEEIKVKSFFEDKWLESEYWGWNDEGENGQPFYYFGCFGIIMFEISKTGMRLFFPSAIEFDYSKWKPNKLYANPYQKNKIKNPRRSPYRINRELVLETPITNMFDLKNHLQGFIINCINDLEDLKIKHAFFIRPKKVKKTEIIKEDLPF